MSVSFTIVPTTSHKQNILTSDISFSVFSVSLLLHWQSPHIWCCHGKHRLSWKSNPHQPPPNNTHTHTH